MALSFDFRLAVLLALFLFGGWASQADAEETSMFEHQARWMARHGRSYKGHANKAKSFKIIQQNVKFSDSYTRPDKPPPKQRFKTGNDNGNGMDSEVETQTPVVNSSPAPPTPTTPPASVVGSVDQIKNRAEMTDSIVQPRSENCDENHIFMGGWSPLVIGAVLFYLLQPGLIFQWPGNNRKFEFRSMKTNGKAMFTHTMIFIAIYAIIIAISHGKI